MKIKGRRAMAIPLRYKNIPHFCFHCGCMGHVAINCEEGEGPREVTGGGGERETNQILLQEPAYVLSSIPNAKTLQEGTEHTNQQRRNDSLKVTNAAEK
jgi:hypothetical protein